MDQMLHERDIEKIEIGGGMHMKTTHVIYSKDGKPHHVGQLHDAIEAINSGHYFAKPPVKAKAPDNKRTKLSGITTKKK